MYNRIENPIGLVTTAVLNGSCGVPPEGATTPRVSAIEMPTTDLGLLYSGESE